MPQGDAQQKHVLDGKKYMNGGTFIPKVGTMTDYTGTSPFHVSWVGGIPGQIRIQLPSGYFESGNPSEQVFILDAAYIEDNIAATKQVFGLPGTFTSDADATATDIATGKTAYVNGQKITGSATPETFAPEKYTLQTNATNFYSDAGDFVLLFNSSLAPLKPNLYGVVVKFMDTADVSWEYESGKTYNMTDMTFNTFKNGADLIANQQKVGMGATTLDINFGSASISGNTISFDMVFTPTGGTFTINNATPMLSVDVWSY